MARLIDADALKTKIVSLINTCKTEQQKALLGRIILVLNNMPDVEIPLQCKTCTWFELDDAKWQEGTCTYWHGRIAADGYCSEGAWTGKCD